MPQPTGYLCSGYSADLHGFGKRQESLYAHFFSEPFADYRPLLPPAVNLSSVHGLFAQTSL
jgi:hypothetical protein